MEFEDGPENNRTCVDKGRSPEFLNAYEDSQGNGSLNHSSQVQFEIKATIRDTDTKKQTTKTAFVEMTAVYGGTDGVKLFLESHIMESVYKWEDSSKEALAMKIQNLYINKKSAIKNYSFKTIKMYGTIFNYLGYMANAGYNNGCCVPQFIFDTLHNPNEKNPRKRIAKLTMKHVIDDLGMVREDEGCCVAQMANL